MEAGMRSDRLQLRGSPEPQWMTILQHRLVVFGAHALRIERAPPHRQLAVVEYARYANQRFDALAQEEVKKVSGVAVATTLLEILDSAPPMRRHLQIGGP